MRAYGRVEIYRPESLVENYEIKSKITAIGRQSGNDLIVDRNGISRYHAKLTFDNQQMHLEDLDSVNGTYVDGVRIPGNEPRVLRGGEEIQIGDVRFVYYPPADEAQQDTAPFSVEEATHHIETEALMMHLTVPDMAVVPGANVQAALILENIGGEPDRYRIVVEGVPRDWVRLERNEVELNPGEQAHILASFKPARRSDTKPGPHPISFVITPKNHPEATAQAESILQIGTYSGYGVTMGTTAIEGSEPFQLHVHNHGNAPMQVSFRGADPQGALRYYIEPPAVTLQPGERRIIEGSIKPRTGQLFGSPRDFRYDIISLAHDASGFQAPVSGKYTSRPLMPGWVPTLAIPAVALVVVAFTVLLLFLLTGDDDTPERVDPELISFTTTASAGVELGQPVVLNWEVENARELTLTYTRPNQPAQEVTVNDPELGTYQLMLDTSGVYTITLLAENSGGIRTENLVVNVLPVVKKLEVAPPTLLRNVEQQINVEWEYEGAETLDGLPNVVLDSPEVPQIQASGLANKGAESYAVRPVDTVSVVLHVYGNDGTQNSLTRTLAVVDPRCLLSNQTATIYSGPDVRFDRLAQVEGVDVFVNPTARNDTHTWLQILYEGVPAWVRVADFMCEGFGVNQLVVAETIPVPPVTPTQPPTQTPTATTAPPTPLPPLPQPTPTRR